MNPAADTRPCELAWLSAAQCADLIRSRQLSPVDLVADALARIEASQPVLNAFITICGERAMAEARKAERDLMSGAALGPLHGVPLSVKDLVPTEGVRTTSGSMIYKDHVPTRDAVAVRRLRAAGAILVGKTTTPEFGMSPITRAPLFGLTVNPWNKERIAGGSSGGAGASIAAGLTPLAVATDGGGSARIPAAVNGVVGFKQSLGVVPHDYADDQFGNVSYVTPTTRTVRDTALMLDAMAGPAIEDPNTIGRPSADFSRAAGIGGDLAGLRIGWRLYLGNDTVSADVEAGLRDAMAGFAEAGAHVGEARHPFDNVLPLWTTLMIAYRHAQYGHLIEKYRDIMCPTLVRQVEHGGEISSSDVFRSVLMRTRLYHEVQRWFDDFDVIAMPTVSRTALSIEHDHFAPIEIDGKTVGTVRQSWYPYTLPFNLTGHPAVSLPCGFGKDGLPVAVQLVGRAGDDAFLMRVAAAFERVRPWSHIRPEPQ